MVNRVNQPPRFLNRIYPNETIASEWDLIMTIWTTLADITPDASPTITHIKGHQDKHKSYQDLSLPAQLNVDADHLANEFISEHQDFAYGWVPILPPTQVQLNFSQGTVTYKLKRTTRLARIAPPLEKKLKKKYAWSDATFQDVDWEASRRALNRLRQHKVTLIKHLNNVPPVGKLVHSYDPKYPAGCPSCAAILEDRHHLYQCNAPSRLDWRKKFLHRLHTKMDKLDTAPDLQELLLEGVKSLLEGRPSKSIHCPPTALPVAEAQSAIGWKEVLKGRLSREWSKAQQRHLGAFDRKKNGQTWATDIAQLLLEGWLELWQLRNDDRHGRDVQTKAQAQCTQALRELKLAYEFKEKILTHHNWILDTPINQRQNLRTYALRAWLNNYVPILRESYHERLATG